MDNASIKGFNKLAAISTKWQEALEAEMEQFKKEMTTSSVVDLAKNLKAMIDLREAQSQLKAVVENNLKVLRENIIPDRMDELEIEKETVMGIGTIYTSADVYVSAGEATKSELHQWLEDTGGVDLIVPTVNASSLKAYCKGKMKKGEEIPEFITVTPFRRASILNK